MVRELRLPVEHLRCLEDGQVDWLFGAAPALGAPLLRARFARGYVDPNREAFELDPALFDRLPGPRQRQLGACARRARHYSQPDRRRGDLSLAAELR